MEGDCEEFEKLGDLRLTDCSCKMKHVIMSGLTVSRPIDMPNVGHWSIHKVQTGLFIRSRLVRRPWLWMEHVS